MDCSRCGSAEAVVKRDAAFYCGRCALARDWEEVIALVQEERVSVTAVDDGPSIDFDSVPAAAQATASAAPATVSAASDVPADPFA